MIVLLGCLALVVFPPLLKQIRKAENSISETTKMLIIDASKDYYEDNKKEFKKIDGVSYCINVRELVEQNYLNGKIKDKDLNDININKEVKLTYLNNKFNYELVDSCNYYTVTFDASGGNVNIEEKQVLENSLYGDLPTPTREGYTFMGWSRNLAEEINEQNYKIINHDNRTTYELKNDGNFDGLTNQLYIRINGNNDDGYIDTLWRIEQLNYFKVSSDKQYKMTFFIRSKNAQQLQYIPNTKSLDTGNPCYYYILWNNGTKTYFENPAKFANDGNWHYIENHIVVPEGITSGKIFIGADDPNLKGKNSYIDISNIQFAEDSAVTPYYINSNTIVKSKQSHTLYAKWKEN